MNYGIFKTKLLVLFLISATPISAIWALADDVLEKLDTKSLCLDASNFKCHGDCDDGWGFDCYFDSRVEAINSNSSVQSQKAKCVATYHMSVCTPCENKFQINGEEVSCQEFYIRLNKFNKTCGNCLQKRSEFGG